jgi:hypothetical protein
VRVAPTTVVIPWPTEPSLEQFRLEADALGLGLVIKVGGTRERLLWPPQRELPFDAGVWRFVERAYGLWLDQRGLGTGER